MYPVASLYRFLQLRGACPEAGFMNHRRLCQLTTAILTSDLTTHICGFYEATQRLSCNHTEPR